MSRIQRAANKSGAKINLIGSRAAGTAEATSDFDYIVEGNERQIHRARSLLPRGTQGGEQSASGADTGIDVFGRLLGVVPVWPTANIVFVGNQPMSASMLLAGFSDDLALVLGVRMKVVLEPAGEGIITAHPLP
jgi:hypothetical protein